MSKLISNPVTASTLTRISLGIITMTIMLGPILGDLMIGEPVHLVNYSYLLVAAPFVFFSTWLLGRIIMAYRKNSEYLNE